MEKVKHIVKKNYFWKEKHYFSNHHHQNVTWNKHQVK